MQFCRFDIFQNVWIFIIIVINCGILYSMVNFGWTLLYTCSSSLVIFSTHPICSTVICLWHFVSQRKSNAMFDLLGVWGLKPPLFDQGWPHCRWNSLMFDCDFLLEVNNFGVPVVCPHCEFEIQVLIKCKVEYLEFFFNL